MSCNVSDLHPAADANKYTRGKLVVIAGSTRYPGAAALAARASQRMGAGYTEVVTAAEAVDVVRGVSPSLVVRSLDEWSVDELPQGKPETGSGKGKPAKPSAVCMGPGFVDDDDTEELVLRVLKRAACPVLVDGGGLARLGSASALKRLAKRERAGLATVITPHGGEAARLAKPFGLPGKDPAKLATGLSMALHAVVVLKGPDTYVADGTRVEAMREGTPALAKAGTGDVLAGMIAALLAQGFAPADAALLGAQLHACAGIAAAERLTDIAVCAEDVVESIPEVLRNWV